MAVEVSESYDNLPYRRLAHAVTHPGRLHAILKLAGGDPATVSRSRVLELGCASGWNLIPLAAAYPDARLVGLDLSEAQVAEGRAIVDELQLSNVDLRHADIMDVDEGWGTFDYIICHGIWSWVPRPVRDKILSIARDRMSPRGAVQISFNVYPRWKLRELIREIMLFHAAQIDPATPLETVQEGRKVLEFIGQYMADCELKTALVKEIADGGVKGNEAYVFHEYFESVNDPCYFIDFVTEAQGAGLRYVADTITELEDNPAIPPGVREFLSRFPHLQQQQYLDFLGVRAFRSALLVHDGFEATTKADPSRMKDASVLLRSKANVPTIELLDPQPTTFKIHDREWTTSSPVARAAVRQLAKAFPEPIAFRELLRRSQEMLTTAGAAEVLDEDALVEQLAKGYGNSVLEFFFEPPRVTGAISEKPTASAFARYQAGMGPDAVSQLHRRPSFDPLAQFVLARLDGSRDVDALVADVLAACERGDLEFAGGAPKPRVMAEWITARLGRLRDAGMLIS